MVHHIALASYGHLIAYQFLSIFLGQITYNTISCLMSKHFVNEPSIAKTFKMPFLPTDGIGVENGVEDLAFEILMESVLKLSKLMSVSVFLLVEQSGGRKRRFGGSAELCADFIVGKLRSRNSGDDVQLAVVEEREEEEEAPAQEEDRLGEVRSPASRERVSEENFEIIETEEVVGGDLIKGVTGKEDYEDSNYSVEDDDSDWSDENHRGKRKSLSRRNLPPKYRHQPKSTRPASLASTQQQQQQGRRREEELIAQQIRDYAEGRDNFEDSSSSGDGVHSRVGSVGLPIEPIPDAGAGNDSGEDDDWKPVNYGRGKLYHREKKKYYRKELRKKIRQGVGGESCGGQDSLDTDASRLPPSTVDVNSKGYDGGDCPHCHRYFQKLRQHVRDVHEGGRKFACEHCASRFKRDGHLKKHLNSIHKISDP